MEVNLTDLFKEVGDISRALKNPIKHMPRYHRYNEGDRIINVLLDIKIEVTLALKGRSYSIDYDKLYNQLITLETLLDECIEEGALLLKGKDTIFEPRKKLIALLKTFN